ncbi:flagellar hook protein [Roseivivax isoporae LMG 25204]|uniref:Flagellar hook protein FlgE n=2 Tax=Roseivivax TaxID=93682 RepID=X7F9V2_9RHOB|nr:flagellar hook protein [Roseivivax isoporae LMG 25204]
MQIGVSGLTANADRVGNISQNIANANTDGYRRSFSQLVTEVTMSQASSSGAGVRAEDRAEVTRGGAVRNTGTATDLAISGDGFFAVSRNANDTNQANYMLTRAGSFRADDDGNLVNAAGFYLSGYAYGPDGTLGTPDGASFGDLQTVNVGGRSINGEASTAMRLAGNLPSQATGLATPGDPFASSAEYYTPLGAAERLRFSWQPGAADNAWSLTVSDDAGLPLGSVDVSFNDSGAAAGAPAAYANVTNLATAPSAFAFDVATGTATITVDNGTAPQDITLDLGTPGTFDGITQFAGDYTGLSTDVDGREAGVLARTEIDETGTVYGIFDNGARVPLYQIPLATVPNANGLARVDGNAFRLSQDSGPLNLLAAGTAGAGSISGGALEGSNVEVTSELTDLIQAQRAYSSNAKIVTTSNEMLEETLQLKR